MNYAIYLRPLQLEDAKTSYLWRNNPLVWEFTPFRPSQEITLETEINWLKSKLQNKNEYRFAICLKDTDQYIGNVQLLDIEDKTGCFHIFIGEPNFWGKGIGNKATSLIIDFGFNSLNLNFLTLEVHKNNASALAVYKKRGFQIIDAENEFIKMSLSKDYYYRLQKLLKPQKAKIQKPEMAKS